MYSSQGICYLATNPTDTLQSLYEVRAVSNLGRAGAGTYSSQGVCYLATNTTDTHLCVYAYFVAGVSMLATILFSLLLVRECAPSAKP